MDNVNHKLFLNFDLCPPTPPIALMWVTSHFILFKHLCNDIFISDIGQLCNENKEDVVVNMIKRRRDICDIRNNYNNTLLHMAAGNGYIHLVEYIVNLNLIPIDSKNNRGQTVLYLARNCNNRDNKDAVIKLLEEA